jgi:hypothetical protein
MTSPTPEDGNVVVPITEAPSAKRAAAGERARRTFIQGLGIDVAVAIAVLIAANIATLDLTSREALVTLGLSVVKTVLTTVTSYVMRLKLKPAEELATPVAA